ncbi:hypothetical protein M6D93_01620 [Jatrophihabitans telluris]|uniref:DUF3618 domain-containing protein n=1 Tax=Jatrophihabitans telluris TaxID=2038343 RepID=A0ABY4QYS2_9ACTN|nr:hypothetical protein [Jatrophihabitans telluris]UQX88714.1 hypothetical protein M6D93_01620 [Jatrophihabitans telluris]
MTNRQPAGAPTGGQFAAGTQTRADVALDDVRDTPGPADARQAARERVAAELSRAAPHRRPAARRAGDRPPP